ncbi:MAG: C39 family peptidase, partial [Chloroflexi bacterium]|nr:C39 family peptidase [Chloroflexota bacterium]
VPLPQPQAVATPSTSGLALLASITSDEAAHWVRTTADTALHSGPSDGSQSFTTVPQWSLLKQTDSRPDWLMVWYSGDGDTRQPGPGWVRASDVGAVDTPSVWLQSGRVASVWSTDDASAKRTLDVPSTTLMEVVAPNSISGSRIHVRLPGDGRQVPPAEGWLDADSAVRIGAPDYTQVPRAYPADLHADIRIPVPYRTQLDGSAYAGANCGPTALGMALEAFGMNEAAPDLRRDVLRNETFEEDDNDAGSYIWALADVAQEKGLHASGLYESDGTTLHHWSVDEVRQAVRSGHPVIAQVVYRGLPGRGGSEYYGDHYVVITGLLGEDFLYNDPIGGATAREAPGYDRVMTASQLEHAMRASDSAYAYTAFSLSRG